MTINKKVTPKSTPRPAPTQQTRTREEIAQKMMELPPTIVPEFRQLLRWMACQPGQDFPPLSRVVELYKGERRPRITAAVPVPGVGGEEAPPTAPAPVGDASTFLRELLSENGHHYSCEHLQQAKYPPTYMPVPDPAHIKKVFEENLYFIDDASIQVIHLALSSGKGLLVSGPPGTGKTVLAEMVAKAIGMDPTNDLHFETVFCTPDIDEYRAIYRWNDAKRLMDLQLVTNLLRIRPMTDEQTFEIMREVGNNTYSLRYLEPHKLLRACLVPFRTVRLIDEIDKAPPWFDNDLLDILAYSRYHVPEYRTYLGRALGEDPKNLRRNSPFFVITSNEDRELSAPLLSRCVPLFLNYPPENLECKIIQARTKMPADKASIIAAFFRKIRERAASGSNLRLRQPPATRETLDTAQAIIEHGLPCTEQSLLSLNCLWLKQRQDYLALAKAYQSNGVWYTAV